jgi:AcrR family transcriptional regulator
MAEVAADAGLAKGSVYGYFRTKEQLFLALTDLEVGAWLQDLNIRLGAMGSPDLDAVTDVLCQSVSERPLLTPLLTILHSVLEHNIDQESVIQFKTGLITRGSLTGTQLESVLPFLPPGAGRRFFSMLWAVLIGVRTMTDPSPIVLRVLKQPLMAPLRLDFDATLRSIVRAILAGLREKYESRAGAKSNKARRRPSR